MKRQNTPRTPKSSGRAAVSDDAGARTGTGRFTFHNGDRYEGSYRLDPVKRTLVKQGQGVYVTDNFDVYEGKWDDDKFADGEWFHIRYNNCAQYKGNVDANGAMSGIGAYVFPDGSSLTALWSRNKPVADVVYREPLRHAWTTESVSENEVSFVTGNHFWSEMREASSKEGDIVDSSSTCVRDA